MNNAENVLDLKTELVELLEIPEINFGRILELASELSQHDPDFVRFTVDAGLISRLGRELVAKQETAVSELVKNAYDADAINVWLTFIDCNEPGGRLIITDNGHGMTREQLINGFMRLSSTDKIHNPLSPKFRRTRAGKKGIGRFAAQRLGEKLIIFTQTKDSLRTLKVEINWFKYQGDQDLIHIANQIEELEKTSEEGTILIIEGLYEAWTLSQIQRIYQYLVDLVQPFPLKKVKDQKVSDPGFAIEVQREIGNEEETVANVEKMVYDFALAEIEGIVDDKGVGVWSISSKQLSIDEQANEIGKLSDNPKSNFVYLRNLNFKAYYYIYNRGNYSNYLPKAQNTFIRGLARERGGIRVYRNGFRVLPYGEQFDDWLKLEEATARRRVLPPFRRENFFGFVELTDITGKVFDETSSREGLIENAAFKELVDFVSRVLESAVFRVAEERGRKQKPTSGDISPVAKLRHAVEDAKKAADSFSKRVSAAQTSNDPKDRLDEVELSELAQEYSSVVETLLAAVKEEETREAQLVEELGMLRVLAGLGLSIGEFTHEINQSISSIDADIKNIQELHLDDKAGLYINRLKNNIKHFRTYSAYFDRAASDNVRREMRPQEMGQVLRSFSKIVASAAHRYGIEMLEPKVTGYDIFTVPMHPSEWASILFNLFTNSVKAIRRAKTNGKIYLSAKKNGNYVYLDFADNGDGIATENSERIYDAFFTTSSPSSPFDKDNNPEELAGTGLGLKIVKDIVNSHYGTIELVTPPKDFQTCFRISMPAASAEELENYGY